MSTPQPPGLPETRSASTPAEPSPPARPAERRSFLRIALLLLGLAYSIAFIVENSKEIRIHFVFATAKVRLIWAMLLLLAIGLVGGLLLSQLRRNRRSGKRSQRAR